MKELKHIKEPCGNEMDVDLTAFIPYHATDYRYETIAAGGKFFKRTYCDTCCTYWDQEFRKV